VQDFIAGNRVDVQEVRLGEPSNINKLSNEQLDAEYQRMFGESLRSGYGPDWRTRRQDIIDELTNPELENGISGATKYERYQLPGGENYREILLTLPPKTKSLPEGFNVDAYSVNGVTKYGVYDATGSRYASGLTKDEALQKFNQLHGEKSYTSSHFDQPNILAHMRVNDRIDADGKKMLLIEEVQSDWHQAGREKGYQSANSVKAKQAFTDYSNELANKYNLNPEQNLSMYATMKGMKPEEVAKYDQLQSAWISTKEGVPDAPFKGTWHQLALKRALKYAADNGYDRVGLTTGSQQAERYKLSKQISRVQADEYDIAGDRQWKLKAYDLNGNKVISPSNYLTDKELAETIGKDFAKKIIADRGGEYKGLDLDVGGEGMKKYYDEIYPAFLEKQGKKYNAKTGETTIGKKGTIEKSGTSYYQTPDTKATVRYIDISPEMRGGVKKGQPLFTAAPIGGIGLGAGTQDNEMPDAVRQYMADPRYSDPFADTTR
jgi:hypothetical protein